MHRYTWLFFLFFMLSFTCVWHTAYGQPVDSMTVVNADSTLSKMAPDTTLFNLSTVPAGCMPLINQAFVNHVALEADTERRLAALQAQVDAISDTNLAQIGTTILMLQREIQGHDDLTDGLKRIIDAVTVERDSLQAEVVFIDSIMADMADTLSTRQGQIDALALVFFDILTQLRGLGE